MVGITAEGYGFDFIWQNLQNFMNGSLLWYGFPLLMLAALAAGKRRYRLIGVYPYLIFLISVCNPLFITAAGRLIGLADRYYRFFWVIPLGTMFGIIAAAGIGKIKWKAIKILTAAAAMALLVIFGVPVYFSQNAPDYRLRENGYYTTDTIISISNELHKHQIEQPVVIYPDLLVYMMCEYDPDLISVFTRGEVASISNGITVEKLDQAIQENNYEKILKYVYLTGWTDRVTTDQFRETLEHTGIDYIVLQNPGEETLAFYQECGCTVTGTVDGYSILYTG